jgi:Lauroyl/myristoyl acyltransferase
MPIQDSFSLRWKRALLIALGWLPLPLLHAIGWLAGVLLWRLPNNLKRTTLRHLELCLPELNDKARSRVARRSLIESMKAVAEAPAIWFGPMRRLRRWMGDTEALRVLRAAAAAPEGLILLTPHLGAWELAGQFAAYVGPISILYKPQRGDWETIIREGRARQPTVQLATTDTSGVKLLLAALGRGEMVGPVAGPRSAGGLRPLRAFLRHSGAHHGSGRQARRADRRGGLVHRRRTAAAQPGVPDPALPRAAERHRSGRRTGRAESRGRGLRDAAAGAVLVELSAVPAASAGRHRSVSISALKRGTRHGWRGR